MQLHIHGIPTQDKARAVGKTNSAAGRALSGEINRPYKAQTERYRRKNGEMLRLGVEEQEIETQCCG